MHGFIVPSARIGPFLSRGRRSTVRTIRTVLGDSIVATCIFFPDWDKVKSMLRYPVIFDGRNLYDPAEVRAHGLEYYGVGIL